MHDDVASEDDGDPLSCCPLKHHRTTKALTNASDDLWRTSRVWRDSGTATDRDGPRLLLMTTSITAQGAPLRRVVMTPPTTSRPLSRDSTTAAAASTAAISESA